MFTFVHNALTVLAWLGPAANQLGTGVLATFPQTLS